MHDHDADEVARLLDRVGAGRERVGDRERLRELVSVRGDGNRVQVGRQNIDISGGRDIRIGDHIYQGADAVAIAEAIRQVVGEPPPPPSRWFVATVSLGFVLCLAAFGVFGYTLFTDTPNLEPGAGPQVPEGVVAAGAMFLTGFVIMAVASLVRAIVNPGSLTEQRKRRWR
jgi:hypothetical protein